MYIEKLINSEKININNIPTYVMSPQNSQGTLPVIFIYHGWSSDKNVHINLGHLLACEGYLVVIPEAINHGERGTLNYWDEFSGVNYFWPTIENSIKEFPLLLNYIEEHYNIDPSRVGVTGHSMGGITTSGILAHHKVIKTAVTMDGSGAWKELSLDFMGGNIPGDNPKLIEALNLLESLSPINNIDNFKDKPLLILHGDSDTVVPTRSDVIFYNAVKDYYANKDAVTMKTFDRLNHFVTQDYVNEMINWFNKYL